MTEVSYTGDLVSNNIVWSDADRENLYSNNLKKQHCMT